MPTLYRIYEKHDVADDSDLRIEDKYPLYAFTGDKDIFKEFCEVRDTDKFIIFNSKISKSELVEFSNNRAYQELKHYKLSHYPKYPKGNEIIKEVKVDVLMTNFEYDIVDSSADDMNSVTGSSIDWNSLSSCPMILKNKYIKALTKLEYISFWKIYGQFEYVFDKLGLSEEFDESFNDYSAPSTRVDTLNLFINIFGHTLK